MTTTSNIKKVYTYKVRGGICAEVHLRFDGKADLLIAARGKKEKGLSAREAFDAAKARQRLER